LDALEEHDDVKNIYANFDISNEEMVKIFLKLKEIPKPDDTVDALAIAICHINTIKW
jgi:hypothetical protein